MRPVIRSNPTLFEKVWKTPIEANLAGRTAVSTQVVCSDCLIAKSTWNARHMSNGDQM
jgi:hypothetical protein